MAQCHAAGQHERRPRERCPECKAERIAAQRAAAQRAGTPAPDTPATVAEKVRAARGVFDLFNDAMGITPPADRRP